MSPRFTSNNNFAIRINTEIKSETEIYSRNELVNIKMTPAMGHSLETLRSSLLCPLCNNVMIEPSTLTCAHSFCHDCIFVYTADNWVCPVVGCGLPVSVRGGGGSSYVRKNPQINAVVSALKNIKDAISAAPDKWWEGSHLVNEIDVTFGGDANSRRGRVRFQEKDDSDADDEIVDFKKMIEDEMEMERETTPQTAAGGNLGAVTAGSGSTGNSTNNENGNDEGSSSTEEFEIADVDRNQDSTTCNETEDVPCSPSFAIEREIRLNQSYALPNFSPDCSPIPMQSSQPSVVADDTLQTVSNIRDNKKPSADFRPHSVLQSSKKFPQKEDKELASYSPIAIKLPSIETLSTPICHRKTGRSSRVSFQAQPRVMLLNPPWSINAVDARCLRKCINDGMISLLTAPGDRGDTVDTGTRRRNPSKGNGHQHEFDSGFDFDTDDGAQSFLDLLSSNRGDHSAPAPLSFYAVSMQKEYHICDGIVVPRSFEYYLAVACGLSIVDVEFLSSILKKKRLGLATPMRFPFPQTPTTSKGKSEETDHQTNFNVVGAADYDFFSPQKARSTSLKRHSLWVEGKGPHAFSDRLLPGVDLLHGFNVILIGVFDEPVSIKKHASKRMRQDSKISECNAYSRSKISLLLRLCGAHVYDLSPLTICQVKCLDDATWAEICNTKPLGVTVKTSTLKGLLQSFYNSSLKSDMPGERTIAVVKDPSRINTGREIVNKIFSAASLTTGCASSIPVVPTNWLLDSIGNFEVKDIGDYE